MKPAKPVFHREADQIDSEIERCLAGLKLYGDDLPADEVVAWYNDEKEGYAELAATKRGDYRYAYHALNRLHGYRFLPNRRFRHVLGFGSAYGDELTPIIEHIDSITILEPSATFQRREIHGVPVDFVTPTPAEPVPFPDQSFDLITCLGVLHHLPNVTAIVQHLARCLERGGYLLLREPIISMGDWRRPRVRLTKRERGIPHQALHSIVVEAGFAVVARHFCVFPVVQHAYNRLGWHAYNSKLATSLDAVLARMFLRNCRYHADTLCQKLRPTSLYYVLQRQG